MTVTNAEERKPEYKMMDRNGDTYPIDPEISEIIHEGFCRISGMNDDTRDFIKAVNKLIADNLGSNIDIVGDLGIVKVDEIPGAYINNAERLKVVLGDDYQRLMIDDERAADGLIELACDADNPLAPEVRGCITLHRIICVGWCVSTNH